MIVKIKEAAPHVDEVQGHLFDNKIPIVKAMVFPVVVTGCKSWTIKKSDNRKIYSFKLWGWRQLFLIPWIARRTNQSILDWIKPQCSLESLMLKWKLTYFDHIMRREHTLEKKTLCLEWWKENGKRKTKIKVVKCCQERYKHESQRPEECHEGLRSLEELTHQESDTTEWIKQTIKCMETFLYHPKYD